MMFKIRNATVEDIELIRTLCFKVWPQTYSKIISKEQIDYMLEMMYSETSLKQQIKEGCNFLIISDDVKPVGYASYQHTGNGNYKLHKIYILPETQGKNAGRFLLDYIIQDITKKNGVALQLQVNRFNKAKDFYERLGFKVIKEANFDIGNGYFMNDYIMEKKLKV